MKKSSLAGLFLALLVLNGCVVGYRRYPHPQNIRAEKVPGTLYYDVHGLSIFGGITSLREYMNNHSPFEQTEIREEAPAQGVYVRAVIRTVSPSVASAVFGYLSLSTLTILPMWSTRDGYTVIFHVFKDGQEVKSFDYETRRMTFLWLGMLPLAWLNLATPSESGVFENIGQQFFEDALPLLRS